MNFKLAIETSKCLTTTKIIELVINAITKLKLVIRSSKCKKKTNRTASTSAKTDSLKIN